MLKAKSRRVRDTRNIPANLRQQAHRDTCAVCKKAYRVILYDRQYGKAYKLRENLDHIFGRFWLKSHKFEPQVLVNLISICGRCHGAKKRAESRLEVGDAIGYVQELKRLNWPMTKLRAAAQFYGLNEVVRLLE